MPYEDNAARFIFFNKAAVELARRLTPTPQVLHVHDWPASLVPVYVKASCAVRGLRRVHMRSGLPRERRIWAGIVPRACRP